MKQDDWQTAMHNEAEHASDPLWAEETRRTLRRNRRARWWLWRVAEVTAPLVLLFVLWPALAALAPQLPPSDGLRGWIEGLQRQEMVPTPTGLAPLLWLGALACGLGVRWLWREDVGHAALSFGLCWLALSATPSFAGFYGWATPIPFALLISALLVFASCFQKAGAKSRRP